MGKALREANARIHDLKETFALRLLNMPRANHSLHAVFNGWARECVRKRLDAMREVFAEESEARRSSRQASEARSHQAIQLANARMKDVREALVVRLWALLGPLKNQQTVLQA